MHTPGTNIVRAVETAAELRAAGHSWAHIAAAVRRSKKTVQRWPQRYADAWNRAAAETRRDLRFGAGGEGLAALRDLLRSENERTRRDAARDLVHLSIDVEPADVPAARSPFHALADHLAGLTDEQHRRLLEEEEPEPEPAPDATGDPEAA
jgi:Homeodomain-like domain